MPDSGKTLRPRPSRAGFLLVDSSFKPLYSTSEAIQILTYPKSPQEVKSIDSFLAKKIRLSWHAHQSSPPSPFLAEFVSGRRRYLCWVFPLNSHSQSPFQPTVGLLLLRRLGESIDISQIAKEFHITQREQEVVRYLVEGLSSKEIGDRMKISPNTVNAFLRLVMIKIGISNRSGIMGKIIKNQLLHDPAESLLNAQNLSHPATPAEKLTRG